MIPQLIQDLYEIPVTMCSRRGWGKSTSLKTIIEALKSHDPEVIIKVFDASLSWYWTAPVKYRQLVTVEAIEADQIQNVGSCVFALNLSKSDTRDFIASIIESDYRERLKLALKYGEDTVKGLPLLIYIIEESNTILGSSSLLKSDKASETFNNFISIGRNFSMTGIFICTRLRELSTGIRERSKLLIGKVLGESDLRLIKAVTDSKTRDLCKALRKYNFIYDQVTFRIPDMCRNRPVDYFPKVKERSMGLRELGDLVARVFWFTVGMGITAPLFLFLLI